MISRILAVIAAGAMTAAPALGQEPMQTPAEHAVIMDYETGQILFEKAAREPMYPASMTKIMTVDMVFERIKDGSLSLDEEFTTSEYAWETGGAASGSSTMFLSPDERVTVGNLLRGVIVQSGNDASIVLAEGLAGTEAAFADEMTARAHDLGLESANFVNATGWPNEEHVISTLDLARLARHHIMEYPDLYSIYAEEEFTYNDIRQYNRNPLLGRIEGVDGLKTGHTEASGYGVVISGMRDGERRIVVINGLESEQARAQEAERLFRSAFADFKQYQLFAEGEEAGNINVALGRTDTLAVRAAEEVAVTLHRNSRPDMTVSIAYTPPRAPVSEGDQVATLIVEAPGYDTMSFPLEAAHDVAKIGLLGRAGAGLVHLIRGSGETEPPEQTGADAG